LRLWSVVIKGHVYKFAWQSPMIQIKLIVLSAASFGLVHCRIFFSIFLQPNTATRGRCYDFLNIFAKNAKKLAFFPNTAIFGTIWIVTLAFKKKRYTLFPRRKWYINLNNNGSGYILGDFFTNSSGHPASEATTAYLVRTYANEFKREFARKLFSFVLRCLNCSFLSVILSTKRLIMMTSSFLSWQPPARNGCTPQGLGAPRRG
jgi:hypothetical protein